MGESGEGRSVSGWATTDEAVRALCTHECSVYPGLKLNPKHCELRKAENSKWSSTGVVHMFEACRVCEGARPIEREGGEGMTMRMGEDLAGETEVREDKAGNEYPVKTPTGRPSVKKRVADICAKCGRKAGAPTEEATPTHTWFYPSNAYVCGPCKRKAKRVLAAGKKKMWSPMPTQEEEEGKESAVERGENQFAPPMSSQMVPTPYPEAILLDFRENGETELWEKLVERARRNRRSILGEILAALDNHTGRLDGGY